MFEILAAAAVIGLHVTETYRITGFWHAVGMWCIAAWVMRGGVGWMLLAATLEDQGEAAVRRARRDAMAEWAVATIAAGLIFGGRGAAVLAASGVLYAVLTLLMDRMRIRRGTPEE